MHRFIMTGLLVAACSASAAPGLFGATSALLTSRYGAPKQRYFDLQRQHIADLFCVTGKYHPFIYNNESGLMELHPELVPLTGDTYGLCGRTQGENVYVRYEKGIAVAFAFGAPHGNTYDQGWIDQLELTLAGIEPGSKVIRTEAVRGSTEGPYRVTGNGARALTFFSTNVPAMVGELLYGPSARVQANGAEPLMNLVRAQALRQQN